MMWRRRVRRAWALTRARRFVERMQAMPAAPGACITLPDDVDMKDVIFWMSGRPA